LVRTGGCIGIESMGVPSFRVGCCIAAYSRSRAAAN
jgi:hypothetical protein